MCAYDCIDFVTRLYRFGTAQRGAQGWCADDAKSMRFDAHI
jgi:hypothetical protein